MFSINTFLQNQMSTDSVSRMEIFERMVDTIGKCINATMPMMEDITNFCVDKHHRRTDDELSRDTSGIDKSANEFQYCKNISLASAVNVAQSVPGVYVLYLNGVPMKCGRASYNYGVAWRFKQYYNLNYDNRARKGDYWSVTKENRDKITVSWQCCPVSKCHELEYKLFKKYGKGAWAQRAPMSCETNSWDLLI